MAETVHDQAIRLLRRLARNRDSSGIAGYLKRAGFRGRRGYDDRCPVAVFLRKNLPPVKQLRVRPHRLELAGSDISLPLAVSEFLREFDGGGYPELDVAS